MSKTVNIPKANYFGTEIEDSNRNFGLDLARSICILAIVLLHSNNFFGKFISYKILGQPGFILQELVFALSGFLIGKQLLSLGNKGVLKGLTGFYKNRWLRTIPFYYFFLVINLGLFYFVYRYSGKQYLSAQFNPFHYFLFIQNFDSAHPYFFPEMWPLAIEEWSYIVVPIALLAARALFKNSEALIVIGVAIIGAVVFRTYHLLNYSFEFDWDVRKVVLMRMDALLYGFIVRVLMEKYSNWFLKNRFYFLWSCLGVCAVAFISRSHRDDWWYASIYFVVMPLFFALTIPFFYYSRFSRIGKSLKKIITHISLTSYAMLLMHLYCLQFMMLQVYWPETLMSAIIFGGIYLLLLMVLSTLFFNYIERPILLFCKSSSK